MAPPPPQITTTVRLQPPRPRPGDAATATLSVHNTGATTAEDLVITSDVLENAQVRGAVGPEGRCTTVTTSAECPLGSLPAGERTSAEITLLIDPEPTSSALAQRIKVSTPGHGLVTEHAVSTFVDRTATAPPSLPAPPGTAVTIATVVGLVLSARSTAARVNRSPRQV